MKKIFKTLFLMLAITLCLGSSVVAISANETPKTFVEKRVPYFPVTVNKSYGQLLYNNGCYANTTIKLTGNYNVSINDGTRTYSAIRLNARATGHPSDWRVEITGVSYNPTQSGLKVTIRYKFLTTYLDCPMVGGCYYEAIVVTG